MAHLVTWILGPQGYAPPFHFILEKGQIPTHKPCIFLFLMIRRIQWPKPSPIRLLLGRAPTPLFQKWLLNMSEMVETPFINHIFSWSLCQYDQTHSVIHWTPLGACHTPSFHVRPDISEMVKIPTPKPYILLFLQCSFNDTDLGSLQTLPRTCPSPSIIKVLISQVR